MSILSFQEEKGQKNHYFGKKLFTLSTCGKFWNGTKSNNRILPHQKYLALERGKSQTQKQDSQSDIIKAQSPKIVPKVV